VSIDTIVFDFGGVFTDSPFEAVRKVGEARGHAFEEAMDVVFGPYDRDTDHPWHRAERGELELEATRVAIAELGRARGVEVDLYDVLGAMSGGGDAGLREPMIERTRRFRQAGFAIGLVTNNLAEFRDLWRPLLPLDELFDVVVDSSEVGIRKPDRRIFDLVLELLDARPERTVFLDDYQGNVDAAEALGIRGILVEADPASAYAALDELLGGATGR